MSRPTVRTLFLAIGISAGAAKTFAVWPPSTSFESVSEASSSAAALGKLEQDERHLASIIQDIADDEAVLKKLTQH